VLTATNSLGSDVYSDTVTVLAAPMAGFSSNSPVLLGQTMVFTNTSSGDALSYAWEFGDGTPVVTATHPMHTYDAAGPYTVTLTASNAVGSDQFTDGVQVLGGLRFYLPLLAKP
jgi:PKD repeat protein